MFGFGFEFGLGLGLGFGLGPSCWKRPLRCAVCCCASAAICARRSAFSASVSGLRAARACRAAAALAWVGLGCGWSSGWSSPSP